MDDIIFMAENIAFRGMNNSISAINYFESQIVTALLHNCESWIGITPEHIKTLQDFQNEFLLRELFPSPLLLRFNLYLIA